MLNSWTGAGRLTRDPELRQTPTGKSVVSFTLAVDRDFKNKDNEREADFIEIVAWNSTAEFVSKYFSKGSLAIVSGRLQVRSWKDDDGNYRSKAEIIADAVYFSDSKSSGNTSSSNSTKTQKDTAKKTAQAKPPVDVDMEDEDDLPF